MSPIVTTAKITCKDRGARDTVLEAFHEIVTYSEKNEPEVLRYIVTLPLDDEAGTDIYMIEEYASTEANSNHISTPPVQSLIELFSSGKVLSSPPIVHTLPITYAKQHSYALPPVSGNPAIVLAHFAYKPGTRTHALQGWKEVVEYVTEKEDKTLAYVIMGGEEEGFGQPDKDGEEVRTVEIYTDWDFVSSVHLKGEEIQENKRQNGMDRVASGAVRVKAIDGFLGRA